MRDKHVRQPLEARSLLSSQIDPVSILSLLPLLFFL
jgi:hypothetical protein